jgi:hypothetical protein
MVIKVIIWIVIGYLFLFFFLPLILLPGFIGKRKFESSKELKRVARDLKKKDKKETLKNIFKYVQETYSSERHLLLILLHKHFFKKVGKLIGKKQYLPCHVQSLVLVTLLLNTGQFIERDMIRHTGMSITGFIHQYYLVRIGRDLYKVDPFYNILRKV